MSQEVALHHVLGSTVHDPNGRKVGRVADVRAEVELHEHGSDYVVTEILVGSFGAIESLVGPLFLRQLLERLGRFSSYTTHNIPWDRIDLTDPKHPRSLDTIEELKAKQKRG